MEEKRLQKTPPGLISTKWFIFVRSQNDVCKLLLPQFKHEVISWRYSSKPLTSHITGKPVGEFLTMLWENTKPEHIALSQLYVWDLVIQLWEICSFDRSVGLTGNTSISFKSEQVSLFSQAQWGTLLLCSTVWAL